MFGEKYGEFVIIQRGQIFCVKKDYDGFFGVFQVAVLYYEGSFYWKNFYFQLRVVDFNRRDVSGVESVGDFFVSLVVYLDQGGVQSRFGDVCF